MKNNSFDQYLFLIGVVMVGGLLLGSNPGVAQSINSINSIFDNSDNSITNKEVAPAAPTGLTATGGNGQVSLTWNASAGATTYNLRRGPVTEIFGIDITTVYSTIETGIKTTNYLDTTVTNGVKYHYEVQAVNAAGTSGNSNDATAAPKLPPAAPTGLSAINGNGQVSLTWNASSGATSYILTRAVQNQAGITIILTGITTFKGITTTSYTDTTVSNGTTYIYEVQAVSASGMSGDSNEATATPQNFVQEAETAIDNYFVALFNNGQNLSSLQAKMTAAIQAVDAADQGTVLAYLNQFTSKAVGTYVNTPNSATLAIAVSAVLQLQPYNNVLAVSGLGLYDNALNQLMQDVSKNLPVTNNVASIVPPANVDGSFGTGVAVDSTGDVFISAPSNATNGNGVIYEFSKNSKGVWTVINQISPITPVPGDHFGRLITINGNTLSASSEPASGKASVYVFALQSNNTWTQQTYLELTTAANVKSIQKIYLASTFNTIVVGLPFQGQYLVFNHVFDYLTTNNTLVRDQWRLALSGNLPGITSVAADGLYIAIGSNPLGSNNVRTGIVRVLVGTIKVAPVSFLQSEYSMSWTTDTNIPGSNGFGLSLALYENPPLSLPIGNATIGIIPVPVMNNVTLAIGSPLENKGAGAVYTMVKSTSTAKFVWSNPSPIQLVMPSYATGGNAIALNGSTLMVTAPLLTQAPSSSLASAIYTGSLVMVYQLNSVTNQWAWAYTVNNNLNSLFGSSLAVNGQTQAVGSPKAVNNTNLAATSEVEVVSPNVVFFSNLGKASGQLCGDGGVVKVNPQAICQAYGYSGGTITAGQEFSNGPYANDFYIDTPISTTGGNFTYTTNSHTAAWSYAPSCCKLVASARCNRHNTT